MNETKLCNKCNLELPISEFYKEGGKLKTPCKKCRSDINRINHKKWKQTEVGKLKTKECKKRYKQKLSNEKKIIREEKKSEKEVLLIERNRVRLLQRELKVKETEEYKKLKEYWKTDEWKEIKKQKDRERQSKNFKHKWDNDELFAIKVRLRNLIRNSFRRQGYKKFNISTEEIVGMGYDDFKKYLESKFIDGMDWDNRGEWHIDHIVPLSSANTEEELISLSHYTNLQPLWAEDNLKKGDKIT